MPNASAALRPARRPPARRRGSAIAWVVALALLAAACAVLAWPQGLGLAQAPGVAQLIAFRGALALGGLGALAIALVVVAASRRGRRPMPALACLVIVAFIAVQASTLLARGLGPSLGGTARDAADRVEPGALRVMSWNTRGDEPGSPTIADIALEERADVVVLPETTEEMAEEVANLMREQGRPMWVHARAIDPDYAWTSTALLISAELDGYEVDESLGDTSSMATIIARPTSGEGPAIVAAHPIAPVPSHMSEWRADLEWLASLCREPNIVMAGDLNATLDHLAPYAGGSGLDFGSCRDAANATGWAGLGTWSAGVPPVLAAPIDHVMASPGWRASAFEVIEDRDLAGSDHRPVAATLERSVAAG